MWGSIIGDLSGSIYEYSQYRKCEPLSIKNKLITTDSFYSDDTILSIAILDAVLHDLDYQKYLKIYGMAYLNYKPDFKDYFKSSFSPGFIKWLKNDSIGNSTGNGAMMRISPIGHLFGTEKEVIENARLATIPSHNSPEAIECATKIAQIIYLARNHYSKEEIVKKLNIQLRYQQFLKFNSTCYETIDNCLYAAFTSNSFEESLYKILSYGGDTDTNACIVGSMAEVLYGIDCGLIEKAKEKIPIEFVKKIETVYYKRTEKKLHDDFNSFKL